jgi:hypothetical protein
MRRQQQRAIHRNCHGDTNLRTEFYSDAGGDLHPNPQPNCHTDAGGDRHPNSQPNCHTDAGGDPDGDVDAVSNGNADSNRNFIGNRDFNGNCDTYGDPRTHGDRYRDVDCNAQSYADADICNRLQRGGGGLSDPARLGCTEQHRGALYRRGGSGPSYRRS